MAIDGIYKYFNNTIVSLKLDICSYVCMLNEAIRLNLNNVHVLKITQEVTKKHVASYCCYRVIIL